MFITYNLLWWNLEQFELYTNRSGCPGTQMRVIQFLWLKGAKDHEHSKTRWEVVIWATNSRKVHVRIAKTFDWNIVANLPSKNISFTFTPVPSPDLNLSETRRIRSGLAAVGIGPRILFYSYWQSCCHVRYKALLVFSSALICMNGTLPHYS